mmetsp:Transcript_23786/g.34704  ORF Transcript_23786/g.34704 Transcript_23786/m.34704 type:complete len:224 (+) Transcript_23786:1466-2137(+)
MVQLALVAERRDGVDGRLVVQDVCVGALRREGAENVRVRSVRGLLQHGQFDLGVLEDGDVGDGHSFADTLLVQDLDGNEFAVGATFGLQHSAVDGILELGQELELGLQRVLGLGFLAVLGAERVQRRELEFVALLRGPAARAFRSQRRQGQRRRSRGQVVRRVLPQAQRQGAHQKGAVSVGWNLPTEAGYSHSGRPVSLRACGDLRVWFFLHDQFGEATLKDP